MLRITPTTNGRGTVLKLEGTLREPWLSEVRQTIEQQTRNLSDPSRVSLDLADVTYVDHSGIDLLRDLIARGAQIRACSGFVAASLGLEERS